MKEVVSPLVDNHGREITYLRLAVTDRCNLRCFYCMPEEGIKYLPKPHLLSYEEMLRLARILGAMGVKKVRITGGEPFVRRDLLPFLRDLAAVPGIEQINMTTNGVLSGDHAQELKDIGIHSINLSLDTIDPKRFFEITRRNEFDKVWKSLHQFLEVGIPTKINMVVMDGKNIEDILPMARLSQDLPIDVRYIEEMPFNGSGAPNSGILWNFKRIIDTIREEYPELERLSDPANSTAYHYKIPGFQGKLGVIAAFTRSFCGTCNRVRLTPQGQLKTCLYDEGVLDVRALLRDGSSDEQIREAFVGAFRSRAKDGFEAEKRRSINPEVSESMSTIGG